jgi:hypothetical protein
VAEEKLNHAVINFSKIYCAAYHVKVRNLLQDLNRLLVQG